MKNISEERARKIRTRMGVLCAMLTLGLGVVVRGAYNIEVRDGQGWRSLAERQRLRRLHVRPKRGTVYDRNNTPLAVSVEVPSVSVDAVELLRGIPEQYIPMRVQQYATRIAAALNLPVEKVAKKLARRRRFAWLKRRVTDEELQAIRALQARDQRYPVRGLMVEGEGRRFYPHRQLAGTLLGFVAPDGLGKEGIELALDRQLRGRAEEIRGLRDRAGRLIFADGIQDEAALAGHNIVLTIDQRLQFIAERELAAAVKTHEAKSGSVLVIDPRTGEILAMASAPNYNPNDYNVSQAIDRRNRAALDRFEPGSTMKVFAMAAALSSKAVKPQDTVYCEEGHMPIDNVVIHDTHPAKWLSPTQILQFSSNIGIAKISLGMGQKKLYDAFRRFGFAEKTGLPVPGEVKGVLRPRSRPWVPVETAAAAFGQGISVTNIQITMALAALANKGRLLEPILVKRVTDSAGTILHEAAPKVRRRVVSGRVARVVGEMMTSVTEGEGTGVEAAVPGFRVAGKTATAQKVNPATGRYNDTHYVSSFMGYVPADRPRLAISVVVDEPMAGSTSGAAVAGPVFRRVAEMSLRYLGVRPRGTKNTNLAKLAKQASPRPMPESKEPDTSTFTPYTGRDGVKIPKKIEGQPIRAAIQAVSEQGLIPLVRGTGKLARTEPPVGSRVARGSKVTLVFEPQS